MQGHLSLLHKHAAAGDLVVAYYPIKPSLKLSLTWGVSFDTDS